MTGLKMIKPPSKGFLIFPFLFCYFFLFRAFVHVLECFRRAWHLQPSPHLWCPLVVVLWRSPLLPLTSSSARQLSYCLKIKEIQNKSQSTMCSKSLHFYINYRQIHQQMLWLSNILLIRSYLPWITFRTSLDVRLPMTIRSRGNWSVLYVRIVCVTTLPKCLVHMVSSLQDKEIIKF